MSNKKVVPWLGGGEVVKAQFERFENVKLKR
jgi:hypothetical protein